MPIYQLVLPSMGESVTEATITKWLKKVGDEVCSDEAVVEVATDKVDSEVASEFNGVVKEILHPVNAIVSVDTPLALIETKDVIDKDIQVENDSFSKVENSPANTEVNEVVSPETYINQARELVSPNLNEETEKKRFYSPLVKSIIKQENISEKELKSIIGSGKDGRVTKHDVLLFIENRISKLNQNNPNSINLTSSNQPTTKNFENSEEEEIPMTRMEQMISEHMIRSQQTSAHVQSFIEIDVTPLWNWREKVKNDFFNQHNVKLTFTPIFLYLVGQILPEFPLLNASLNGTTVIKKKNINLGMATALKDGSLIVPVIKKANSLNLIGLAKKVHELASNARSNSLNPDDIQGGTYTVTNVGMFSSLMGTPIINQPQLAILALGAIRKIPAVIETEFGDVIAIRQQMIVSHSYDHRIINGAMGGMFLKRLKERIENWDESQAI